MPRLAEVARIEGEWAELLERAAHVRRRARERDERLRRLRERELIERLMRQRKAAGE